MLAEVPSGRADVSQEVGWAGADLFKSELRPLPTRTLRNTYRPPGSRNLTGSQRGKNQGGLVIRVPLHPTGGRKSFKGGKEDASLGSQLPQKSQSRELPEKPCVPQNCRKTLCKCQTDEGVGEQARNKPNIKSHQ